MKALAIKFKYDYNNYVVMVTPDELHTLQAVFARAAGVNYTDNPLQTEEQRAKVGPAYAWVECADYHDGQLLRNASVEVIPPDDFITQEEIVERQKAFMDQFAAKMKEHTEEHAQDKADPAVNAYQPPRPGKADEELDIDACKAAWEEAKRDDLV